jgi:hypothetical protein
MYVSKFDGICSKTEVLLRIQQRKRKKFQDKEKELKRKIRILLNKPIQDGQSPILGNSRIQITSRVH